MYFSERESLDFRTGGNLDDELLRISTKYIADNPANDFVYRMYDGDMFKYKYDCGYDFNLTERFPHAAYGSWCYIAAKTFRAADFPLSVKVSCYGPLEIYCNGSLVYTPSLLEAVDVNASAMVELPLKQGENTILVKAQLATSGFGCRIAPANTGWGWISWESPFGNYGGFAYSEPLPSDIFGGTIPEISDCTRDSFDFKWYPEAQKSCGECDFASMFNDEQKGILCGWSSVSVADPDGEKITFIVKGADEVSLYAGGKGVTLTKDGNTSHGSITLPAGEHDILVSYAYQTDLNFTIKCDHKFQKPCNVQGLTGNWLYTGPLTESIDPSSDKLHTLFTSVNGEGCYWRADYMGGYVRPYLSSEHFGNWTYPIGVALYGLIGVARTCDRPDIIDYVRKHVHLCAKLYQYALWDKKRFGHPEIDHEIIRMELLDDCGSFGSSMLEAFADDADASVVELAADIAKYITEKNPRQPDGALYRLRKGHYVNNTLWADDLYMSIPFLCRYYKLTGDEKYIEFAAEQFFLFKKYLFMPEYHIMSHVYDFKYNTYNRIPWGRGNGWVLFSLSELLSTVPEDFSKRNELLDFYRELAGGYLALQGENGLWHQVLTEADSYEETSCTSMFVYAFSKGVIEGWFPKDEKKVYFEAARRGWKGITERAVDQYGNVFGVCQGSGYSFMIDYYKHNLKTITNDIHGIGIVLLAGVALKRLLGSSNSIA